MLKSILFGYSDAYILVAGTITVIVAGAIVVAKQIDWKNK